MAEATLMIQIAFSFSSWKIQATRAAEIGWVKYITTAIERGIK